MGGPALPSKKYRYYNQRRRLVFLPLMALLITVSLLCTVFLLSAINTEGHLIFSSSSSALNHPAEIDGNLLKTRKESPNDLQCSKEVIHTDSRIDKLCINNDDDFKPAINSGLLDIVRFGGFKRECMSISTITVSNSSELKSALSNASGGETIVLKNGYYGDLTISNENYNSSVNIVAENNLGADFGKVTVTKSSNISFDGLDTNDFAVYDTSHVTIKNSYGIIYLKNVYHADIDNNEVEGSYNGITLNDVRHFSVTNNYVHHAQSDLLRVTGDSYDGLIDNNILYDALPVRYSNGNVDHADAIQIFSYGGSTPSNLTISRNLIVDDLSTGAIPMQGIFIAIPDDGYKNYLIEDNLINVGSPNSIYMSGGQENVIIRNNSLIANEGGGGNIILANKTGLDNSGTTVTGNIAKVLSDETKSSNIGDYYFYGRDPDLSKLFSGDGDSWQAYQHVDG